MPLRRSQKWEILSVLNKTVIDNPVLHDTVESVVERVDSGLVPFSEGATSGATVRSVAVGNTVASESAGVPAGDTLADVIEKWKRYQERWCRRGGRNGVLNKLHKIDNPVFA